MRSALAGVMAISFGLGSYYSGGEPEDLFFITGIVIAGYLVFTWGDD